MNKKPYQSIVVLTGAGVSAESGVKTFRASDGLWEEHRIEDVASPEGFHRNPALVQRFYNDRRRSLLYDNIQPNLAHQVLADFEKQFSGSFLLVTQNIDNLHESAGSKHLIHMHGELFKARCISTQNTYHWQKDITAQSLCPCCHTPNQLRPHVVWFGEMPLGMNTIYQALEACDLFVSIGTSGNVYPAAGFCQIANQVSAHSVELNLEPSNNGSQFTESHYGPATKVVPEFFSRL